MRYIWSEPGHLLAQGTRKKQTIARNGWRIEREPGRCAAESLLVAQRFNRIHIGGSHAGIDSEYDTYQCGN